MPQEVDTQSSHLVRGNKKMLKGERKIKTMLKRERRIKTRLKGERSADQRPGRLHEAEGETIHTTLEVSRGSGVESKIKTRLKRESKIKTRLKRERRVQTRLKGERSANQRTRKTPRG
jgi:hypothetical protein